MFIRANSSRQKRQTSGTQILKITFPNNSTGNRSYLLPAPQPPVGSCQRHTSPSASCSQQFASLSCLQKHLSSIAILNDGTRTLIEIKRGPQPNSTCGSGQSGRVSCQHRAANSPSEFPLSVSSTGFQSSCPLPYTRCPRCPLELAQSHHNLKENLGSCIKAFSPRCPSTKISLRYHCGQGTEGGWHLHSHNMMEAE